MKLTLVLVLASAWPAFSQEPAPDLAGRWQGSIPLAGLDFDADLVRAEGGGYAGDLSSPAQGIGYL